MIIATIPAATFGKESQQEKSTLYKKSVAFNQQGVLAFYKGNYAKARKYHGEALRLALSIDDTKTALAEYINIAIIERKLTRHKEAISQLEKAYNLASDDKVMAQTSIKRGDHDVAVANISTLMAATLLTLKDIKGARVWSERALDACHRSKCKFAGTIFNVTARLEIAEDNFTAARKTAGKALSQNRKEDNGPEESGSLRLLAKTAQTPNEALDYYIKALFIDRALGLPSKVAEDLIGAGESYSLLGNTDKAKLYYQRAHTVATADKNVKMVKKAAHLLEMLNRP